MTATSPDRGVRLGDVFDYEDALLTAGPLCEKDGIDIDTYGGEREWQCGYPGTVTVPSGRLLCEDHAGELGYGPKQEEYGFDPADEPEFAAAAAAEAAS
jgi:hypothetical protein